MNQIPSSYFNLEPTAKRYDTPINFILILSTGLGFFAFIAIWWRAADLGSSVRDILQSLCWLYLCTITVRRKHLSTNFKLVSAVIILWCLSLSGISTQGITSSSLIYLVLPTLLVCVGYSRKLGILVAVASVLVFILGSIIHVSFIPQDAEELIKRTQSLSQYTVTLLTLIISISIAYHFISMNRRENQELMEKIQEQNSVLAEYASNLEYALHEIKTLRGIIPICSLCYKIKDIDGSDWSRLEKYISENTNAMLSHGLCPTCMEKEMES